MRIFKFNYFYLFTLFSFCLVYLNLLRFTSFKDQVILLSDLTNNTYNFDIDDFKTSLYPYPSLTVSAIPINSLKARYQFNLNQIERAQESLDRGIRHNPYMIYSHYIKSRIYLSENKIIKSLDYLREGFSISPNNSYLSPLYFTLLSQLNLNQELILAYDTIVGMDNLDLWKFYYISVKNLKLQDDNFLNIIIESATNSLGISKENFFIIVDSL
ncbi:MAG: tetratricopeptide repeat protein [Candidatus Marisimplicoccus sp.]